MMPMVYSVERASSLSLCSQEHWTPTLEVYSETQIKSTPVFEVLERILKAKYCTLLSLAGS